MDTAGKVVIEIDAESKKFDKTMDEVEKRLKELEEKSKTPHEVNGTMIVGNALTEEEEKEYDELLQKQQELWEQDLERSRAQRQINDELEKQSQEAENIVNNLRETDPELYAYSQILDENLKKYKELMSEIKESDLIDQEDLNKAEELREKIRSILKEIEQTRGIKLIVKGINDANEEVKKINFNLNNIGNSIKKSIKNVLRWGLAIFGIRGAYMMVRNAMSAISQEDEQLKANIDYIKAAFAYTLEPVIRRIVDLAKELMIAIQHIAFVLTGKNIFANANKGLQNAVKGAKELNKQMAPWDEMNVLGSNSGSGSGTVMPDFDLTKMNELSKTGQGLIGVVLALAGAISAMKLSELLKTLGLINGELTIMQGLGIFGLILSIYNIVKDLQEIWEKFDSTVEDNNTTLRDWGDVLQWVGIGIASIGLIIGGLPAIVVGAIVAIFAVIMKYWDEIKAFITDKVFGWIDKQIEKLEKTTIGQFLANILREIKLKIAQVMIFFDDTFNRIKRLFDGITKVFKGDSSGWRDIFGAMLNGIIRKLNGFINGMNSMISRGSELLSGLGKIFGANWNVNVRIPNIPYLAKGGIVNMPGRGVPIGNAIAGERGREAVLPLQDSQVLSEIADAIGSRININATVPVYVGNRLVMREMKRINAEDNFAYNR